MSKDEIEFIINDIIKPSRIDLDDLYLGHVNDEIRVTVSDFCEDGKGEYFEADRIVILDYIVIRYDDEEMTE